MVIAEHKVADPAVADAGIDLVTAAVRRPPPNTLDQRWNCHSKLHEVVALLQAIDAGGDEALMLDVDGHVATCNATNFFVVTGGEVWTSTGEHCLNGITRRLVLELAADGRDRGPRAELHPGRRLRRRGGLRHRDLRRADAGRHASTATSSARAAPGR